MKLSDLKPKHLPLDLPTAGVTAVLAVTLLAAALWPGHETPESPQSSEPEIQQMIPLPVETLVERPDPEPVARPHLDWAAERCLSESQLAADDVRALFADARSRVPEFVAEARGWNSKFHLISGMLQGNNEHAEFLRNRFEALVLSEAQLRAALQRSLTNYQQAISSLEGELLVKLRADLPDLAGELPVESLDELIELPTLESLIAQTGDFVGDDLQGTLLRELTSVVISELVGQVGVHLGIAAGVLNPGEDRDWSTFAVELGVGWFLDEFVVKPLYEETFQPNARLTSDIESQLDGMEAWVLEGDETRYGWADLLTDYARARSAWREAILLNQLREPTGDLR